VTERDYEAEASEQGWTPKEDWKGDPEKWTDSKTFVERGEKIAGILKSRLDKQDAKIQSLQDANKKFGEYHKQTLEAQREKTAKTIAELEVQVAQAVTDGDGQAYTRHNRELNDLKTALPEPDNSVEAWNEQSQQWVGDNPWYNTNRKLGRFADGIAEEVIAEGYRGTAYFSELTKRVKDEFPEEFENPNKSTPNVVEEGGQRSTTNSKAHTYENLSREEKRVCDGFVAEGFMTREDYVANYEWED